MVEFNCDKCNQRLTVQDNFAGQQIKCPACQAPLTVPIPSVGATQPPASGNAAPPPMPPQFPPTGYPMPPGAQSPTKDIGMAMAAFILGLCSIIPVVGFLTGLLAIIFAIIALAQKSTRTWMAITGLIMGLVFPVMIALPLVLLPALSRSSELARQASCQANMNSLGKGFIMYTVSGMTDEYPPDLDVIIKSGYISESCLRCPSNANSVIGVRDYLYVCPVTKPSPVEPGAKNGYGGSSVETVDPRTIVACDIGKWHSDGGRSVLYADGTVRFAKTDAMFRAELADPINAKFAAAFRQAEAKAVGHGD